jgi:hypothetical protein
MIVEVTERAANPQRASGLFGARFLGVRQPGWHQIGTVVEDEDITVPDAFTQAGLNYRVEKFPIDTTAYGEKLATGQYAIVREPTPDDGARVFGIVGPNYEVIQNEQLAELLSAVDLKLSTVGALHQGKITFVAFNAGETEIGGEKVDRYVGIMNQHGGGAARVVFTDVRFQCQNTLVTGLRSATQDVRIPHRVNAGTEVQFQVQLMPIIQRAQAEAEEAFNQMTKLKVDEAIVARVLEGIFPMPKSPQKLRQLQMVESAPAALNSGIDLSGLQFARERHEKHVEMIKRFRGGISTLYEKFNDEQPELAQTGWALYNAATENADWRKGRDAAIGESILWGPRAAEKARAFDAVMAEI